MYKAQLKFNVRVNVGIHHYSGFYEGGNIQDLPLSGHAHALWVWRALGCLASCKLDDIITVNLGALSRGRVCPGGLQISLVFFCVCLA